MKKVNATKVRDTGMVTSDPQAAGLLLILAITSLKGRLRRDYHNCLGSAIYAARARLRDAAYAGFRYKKDDNAHIEQKI